MESVASDVRFSNRPVGVKHFQTIRHCSVERERALGTRCHRLCRRCWGIGVDFGNGMAVAQSRLGRSGPHQTEKQSMKHISQFGTSISRSSLTCNEQFAMSKSASKYEEDRAQILLAPHLRARRDNLLLTISTPEKARLSLNLRGGAYGWPR
jgi:hypothetical protein